MPDEPTPKHEPRMAEDAKNLSIVGASAAVAGLLSLTLVGAALTATPWGSEVRRVDVRVVEPASPSAPLVVVSHVSGAGRLYGTVRTRDGEVATGYIRWDRNEGSWADLLDASKPRPRGNASLSGIRFGHIQRMDVLSRDAALLTLRSGERVEMSARATDLGDGLRALRIQSPDGRTVELGWRDLDEIDFSEAPEGAPAEGRLYGTVTTQSGAPFTGYVTWDVDEIYTTDILDGDDEEGVRREIAFGEIISIERAGPDAARVTLADGSVLLLDGTNDVDESIRGISVSDPGLGQVQLDWDGFRDVRFHGADADAVVAEFDGGAPIRGTVVVSDGQELSGEIVWDADEEYTWEMLNGEMDGVTYDIEFGRIERIRKVRRGAEVTLLDGRAFVIGDSNDVDEGNRGILVKTATGAHEFDWDDFVELRLTP
ncbi:MAG TPA: hypothetical protein VMM35_06010 [Longimicrobiales bacterium]|nr:hypothetical protein [Longimicrobiales bacterium]